MFYGEGYDWGTVYNMPNWLRKFTYNKIEEHFLKKSQDIDNQNNILTADNAENIMKNSKQINNSYSANIKAPKNRGF